MTLNPVMYQKLSLCISYLTAERITRILLLLLILNCFEKSTLYFPPRTLLHISRSFCTLKEKGGNKNNSNKASLYLTLPLIHLHASVVVLNNCKASLLEFLTFWSKKKRWNNYNSIKMSISFTIKHWRSAPFQQEEGFGCFSNSLSNMFTPA